MTKPEDMTIDEIREQLALYNRLYYNKRREDKEYLDKKGLQGIDIWRRRRWKST